MECLKSSVEELGFLLEEGKITMSEYSNEIRRIQEENKEED